MSSHWLALAIEGVVGSHEANAACVIHGARPTAPLPTMLSGQEFSFIASPDCETLRFSIRRTAVRKNFGSGATGAPGPHTYKVVLTEHEWNNAVAASGSTLTWVVIGRTSAGVTTRMVTTNDLKPDETITINLSMAHAKLVGEQNQDSAGIRVSGAGDVNGDGNADLLVGAPENNDRAVSVGGNNVGAVYVVLGPVSGTLNLSVADAKLVGEERNDRAGSGASGAGDVDGDGHDDVLVGAPLNNEGGGRAGAAYLVLGPVTGTVNLSVADAKLVGEEAGNYAGYGPSGAGDVDGDGHDDVLVDAYGNSEGGSEAGAAYLMLGPVTGTLDLSLADAKLVGEEAFDAAGAGAGAGDMDGDGHDDVLVCAIGHDDRAGAAYLVLGPVSGTVDLSVADAKLVGEARYDYVGTGSGAGDVDGDGHADLVVGAPNNNEGGSVAGAAYLVLGPVTGTRDLSLADAKLVGEEETSWAGGSVDGAGDVDGDGHDDLLVGAQAAGPSTTGAAYLVLGPVTGTLDLALADVKLVGEGLTDYAGGSVSGAGDVDGDDLSDLLVGASGNNEGGSSAGAAYLLYGGGL